VLPLDVSDDMSVAEFASQLGDQPIDLLINNAGVIGPERQSSLDMDYAGFLETLNVNTIGPLRVTQALLGNLRKSAAAKLVILTSRMGSLTYAKSDRIAYRASKAAANKVVQCLATDLEPMGIAVAAIHPGWVRTDLGGPSADIAPDESVRGIKAVIETLSLALSGRFWNYDGSELAW
jgi:NAD(P)-dependent dehydrogenase (short-subunit alcohol dehydrogenase family)